MLALAASVIVALPLPAVGDTVTAEPLLDAVHVCGEQPAGVAVNVTFCVPPFEPNDTVVGDTENAHAAGTSMTDGVGVGFGATGLSALQEVSTTKAPIATLT